MCLFTDLFLSESWQHHWVYDTYRKALEKDKKAVLAFPRLPFCIRRFAFFAHVHFDLDCTVDKVPPQLIWTCD